MSRLDFLVDVVSSGSVLGVGAGDSPDYVARRLGGDFTEDRARTRLRRDYGIAEFFWARQSRGDRWESAGFTLQLHRLARDPGLAANLPVPELIDRRVPFAELNASLTRLGYHLEEITAGSDLPGYRRYWLADSLACVIVTAVPWDGLTAGDVFAVHAPLTAREMASAVMSQHHQAVRDGLDHLLRLPGSERDEWLDRHQPVPEERVNWWLYLLLVIDSRIGGQPGRRSDWIGLRLWLLAQGRARGVLTDVSYAEDLACFTLRMRRASAAAPGLPPPEDVVRTCFDSIPVAVSQAPVRDRSGNLAARDPSRVLHSRQAKQLLTAARWHMDAVTDPALLRLMAEWENIMQFLA